VSRTSVGDGFVAHHDRQDHHFHQHGRECEDHRAVRVADFFCEQFGVMGHAHRGGDDEGDQHPRPADQRDDLAAVLSIQCSNWVGDARGDHGQQQKLSCLRMVSITRAFFCRRPQRMSY
jgi:hypothetical protein